MSKILIFFTMDTHIPSVLLDDLDQLDSLNLAAGKKAVKPKQTIVPSNLKRNKKDQRADEIAAAFGVINEFLPRPSSKHSRESAGPAKQLQNGQGGPNTNDADNFSDMNSVGELVSFRVSITFYLR
jgi:hypothetical protein